MSKKISSPRPHLSQSETGYAEAIARPMPPPARVIVGLSGASGSVYGVRLLEMLAALRVETHLVMSKASHVTLAHEMGLRPKDVAAKATISYPVDDIAAAISSGSFPTAGMAIAPCSVRTMSEIATGATASLLTRAADVTLKERRPLLLLVRETPLHLGHLRTMTALAEMGAIIMPPVPAFYTAPQTLKDIVDETVARILAAFGYRWPEAKIWGGLKAPDARRISHAPVKKSGGK